MSLKLSPDILGLSTEAALLCYAGKIKYANAMAKYILGADCLGKTTESVFGKEASQCQAGCFIMDCCIHRHSYALRVNNIDGVQLIFLSGCDASQLMLSEALLSSLRQSLMNYSMSAEIIRNRATELEDECLLSALRSISHCYHKIKRILNNASTLMDISKGSLVFSPAATNIQQLLASLLGTLELLRPDISFSLRCANVSDMVLDAGLFELMVLNLVSNAMCHASGCSSISLGVLDTAESIIFSVSDDGCGIAPDRLGSVFDRYCHSFGMQELLSGAGLGMSVARAIARLHGGTVLLESREGKGTTVRVSISRALENLPVASPQASWSENMDSILTGLADCLPDSLYSELYMD